MNKCSKIIFSFVFLFIFVNQNFAGSQTEDRFEKLINVIELGRTKNTSEKMKFLDERLKMDKEKKLFGVLDKFFKDLPDCYLDVALDVTRKKNSDLKTKTIPEMQRKVDEIKGKNIPLLERQIKSAFIERRFKKQTRVTLNTMKSKLNNLNKDLNFFESLTKYYLALINYLETKLGEKEYFFRLI